jgi:hypothetical protein
LKLAASIVGHATVVDGRMSDKLGDLSSTM